MKPKNLVDKMEMITEVVVA
uniref:Uncharacterized protein n=1 Tax=Arundo donax TaxID=35708 RepID=A0A0A9C5R5_ARUDO